MFLLSEVRINDRSLQISFFSVERPLGNSTFSAFGKGFTAASHQNLSIPDFKQIFFPLWRPLSAHDQGTR